MGRIRSKRNVSAVNLKVEAEEVEKEQKIPSSQADSQMTIIQKRNIEPVWVVGDVNVDEAEAEEEDIFFKTESDGENGNIHSVTLVSMPETSSRENRRKKRVGRNCKHFERIIGLLILVYILVDQVKLLNILRDYPCLYDKKSSDYKDFNVRTAAYLKINKSLGMEDSGAVKRIQSRIHYILQRLRNGPFWVKKGHGAPSKSYRKQWDELNNAGAFLKLHETIYKSANSIRTSPKKSEKKSKAREAVAEFPEIHLSGVSQPSPVVSPISALSTHTTSQKSQMMLFFESICPDVECLTRKQQMQFRIDVMRLISEKYGKN